MLLRIVNSQWFPLADLVLVMLSGALWMLKPELGLWVILIALLPWILRTLAGRFPFRRTPLDWLIVVFLATAWVGYWMAYDKTAAWYKFWLIALAVLLYYALSAQSRSTLPQLSYIFFLIGLGVSVYFFLTQDFAAAPGSIADWWQTARPQVEWPAVHHGYISGIVLITSLLAAHGILKTGTDTSSRTPVIMSLLIAPGLGIMLGAFVLTLSRGVWLAIAGAAGAWAVWKILSSVNIPVIARIKPLFPIFVLALLAVIVFLVYIGPGGANYNTAQSDYGTNTRSELFLRGYQILGDFPILGGGLGSFPGLYSHYMLGIPVFYFANTYNMFLDVAIEQGLIGGLAFVSLYLGSLWLLAKSVMATHTTDLRVLSWFALFALTVAIVHGMLYDYLYNGVGAFLLLFPVGVAMIGVLNSSVEDASLSAPVQAHIRRDVRPALVVSGALVILLAVNFNHVRALWHANLGAARMAQVELAGFPTNTWTESSTLPELEEAEASLHSALRLDPASRTANHRLGLIAMLRGDFDSACAYLKSALEQTPSHRGIIKSLGYCYVWLGNMEQAQALLDAIPESRNELDIYAWWWGERGRFDLSSNASLMVTRMDATVSQP